MTLILSRKEVLILKIALLAMEQEYFNVGMTESARGIAGMLEKINIQNQENAALVSEPSGSQITDIENGKVIR